ncbi:DUF1476 domain-containing protein [Epibacterium ulvae]|uniref:DUF1476 domain-containing protein n=1 Tax=Epibacterium ulvae TaxID=1156985 RepID=A0A1G5QAF0_9RHOB|nr:DUF1476 domain-containing protein [Epibacterium ulvae]SCZ58588.1 hypothetical protein SAMN04488118_103350 [Epibacterium ulvae]
MRLLHDRKQALENKFAHEAELDFMADARTNKMLGMWAAKKLAISGDDAEAFASEYVKTGISATPQHCVISKAAKDLKGHVSRSDIKRKFAELAPSAHLETIQVVN